MWTETGIKDVYRGVQGACPRRAVTHAGGTAERSERRAVGMGLKLVLRPEEMGSSPGPNGPERTMILIESVAKNESGLPRERVIIWYQYWDVEERT